MVLVDMGLGGSLRSGASSGAGLTFTQEIACEDPETISAIAVMQPPGESKLKLGFVVGNQAEETWLWFCVWRGGLEVTWVVLVRRP